MSIENEPLEKFFCDAEHPTYTLPVDSRTRTIFSPENIAKFAVLRSHLDQELGHWEAEPIINVQSITKD